MATESPMIDTIKCQYYKQYLNFCGKFFDESMKEEFKSSSLLYVCVMNNGLGDLFTAIKIVNHLAGFFGSVCLFLTDKKITDQYVTESVNSDNTLFIKYVENIYKQTIKLNTNVHSNLYTKLESHIAIYKPLKIRVVLFGPANGCREMLPSNSLFGVPIYKLVTDTLDNPILINITEMSETRSTAIIDPINKELLPKLECRNLGLGPYELGLLLTDYSSIEDYDKQYIQTILDYKDKGYSFIYNYIYGLDVCYNVIMLEVYLLLHFYEQKNAIIYVNKLLNHEVLYERIMKNPHLGSKCAEFNYHPDESNPEMSDTVTLTMNVTSESTCLVYVKSKPKYISHNTMLKCIELSDKVVGCTGDNSLMEVISAKKMPLYEALPHKYNIYNHMINLFMEQELSMYNSLTSRDRNISPLLSSIFTDLYRFLVASGDSTFAKFPDSIGTFMFKNNILQSMYKIDYFHKYHNANKLILYCIYDKCFPSKFASLNDKFVAAWTQTLINKALHYDLTNRCKSYLPKENEVVEQSPECRIM